jgi:hypothetical protein
MNRTELEHELKAQMIPAYAYSLNGGDYAMFCITRNIDKWETYSSDRGMKCSLKIFDTEDEACAYFLDWMVKFKRAGEFGNTR